MYMNGISKFDRRVVSRISVPLKDLEEIGPDSRVFAMYFAKLLYEDERRRISFAFGEKYVDDSGQVIDIFAMIQTLAEPGTTYNPTAWADEINVLLQTHQPDSIFKGVVDRDGSPILIAAHEFAPGTVPLAIIPQIIDALMPLQPMITDFQAIKQTADNLKSLFPLRGGYINFN